VTAKERLLERVAKLTEAEADETLRLLEEREDPVLSAFGEAPEDDEPWTEDDEAAMAEVEADRAAGVTTIPLEEIKRKHGLR
jgi:hypothetical protein